MQDEGYDNNTICLTKTQLADFGVCFYDRWKSHKNMSATQNYELSLAEVLAKMPPNPKVHGDPYACPNCGDTIRRIPGDNMWKCNASNCQMIFTMQDPEPRIQDITQEDWALLIEALEMAVACKEVEVDVAQAEADSKADVLRDLIVLKRKLETA